MKNSDSSNSLTRLQEQCEAKCSFCNFGEDIEAGRLLIYSKQFTGCGCDFTTHLYCWKQYLDRIGVKDAKCPMCQQAVGILQRDPYSRPVVTRSEYHTVRPICKYYVFFFSFVFTMIVSFVLYFTFVH